MTQYLSYVYAYLRPDGSPYYIGKGKKYRAFDNKGHSIAVPKDKSRIVFLETNLSDIGALALERRYIKWYGRKDNNTGILRNMTDGGDGATGQISKMKGKMRELSPEARKKISESAKNRFFSVETRRKLSEASKRRIYKPFSVEHKRKLSEAKRNITPETRRKLSEAVSAAVKRQISWNKGKKGQIPWNKGLLMSEYRNSEMLNIKQQ